MKQQKRGRGGAQREEKKKVLAARRKILNVDHLQGEKLMQKAEELHKWFVDKRKTEKKSKKKAYR